MSDDSARHAGSTGDANFTPSTLAEQHAHAQGVADRYDRRAAGAGGGGGGTLMLPLIAIYMACLWPLVAVLTFVPGYLAWRAVERAAPGEHPWLLLIAPVIAGGVGLFAGVRIEKRLQRAQLYRGLRHIVRLAATTVLATWAMLHYPGTPSVPPDWTLAWINQNLGAFRLFLIVALVVVTQVLSARMDRKLRDEQDEEGVDYDIAQEDRGDRWRRRGRSFLFFGIAGAILVPILGLEDDNMLPAFVFGGACGVVLSRWLYPWCVHPVWRLLPWVYFGTRSRRERARRRKQQVLLKETSAP